MLTANGVQLLAVPYLTRGRDPEQGFDCLGLVEFVLREHFGIAMPDYGDWYVDENDGAAIEAAINTCRKDWYEVQQPQAGDVVLLRDGGIVRHMGVMLTPQNFMHTMRGRGTAIEPISSIQWRHRVAGFYRYE